MDKDWMTRKVIWKVILWVFILGTLFVIGRCMLSPLHVVGKMMGIMEHVAYESPALYKYTQIMVRG